MTTVAVVLVILVLQMCVSSVSAAFPNARWKRPNAYAPEGDARMLHKKLNRRNPDHDPAGQPPPDPNEKRKSRSYHFKYGPIFPERRPDYENSFFPADHMLYWG
jgi:hypothetical protein